MKDHRGKYERDTVLKAMADTRLTSENKTVVLKYLCEGVRLKDLPVGKQQAYARIKKVIELINT